MSHEHDYQPVGAGGGAGSFSVPRKILLEEGLSLQAVFADAVLKSKEYLDESEAHYHIAINYSGDELLKPKKIELYLRHAEVTAGMAQAYARLAQAVQHGAPGQRF
jgi:hypothetical protein